VEKELINKVISKYESFCKSYFLADIKREKKIIDDFKIFIDHNQDCFERSNSFGHITASALILNPSKEKILLTLHKKLGMWLQLGGHADGCTDPAQVAMKEAKEESGLSALSFVDFSQEIIPVDLDIHLIPKNANDPAHYHYDLRYILISGDERIKISDESEDLKWFDFKCVYKFIKEESLRRLLNKGEKLISI
jgi:8-oxo-dGTP pyrophosphatase MutT (NUDIX family)